MNIKKRTLYFTGTVTLLLLLSSFSYAAFSEKDSGTRAAQFLKLPVGAKPIGMGEAYTAIADDVNALFYNPAGLAQLKRKSGEFMFSKYIGETSYEWIAIGLPISKKAGALGIGIQYFSAGSMDETTVNAQQVGSFTPSDLAVHLAYAKQLGNFPLGLNLKFIQSKIKETATSFALDLGSQYVSKESKLLLGFSLQNLGDGLKYENEKSKLPILIKLGIGSKINKQWLVSMDGVFPEDNSPTFGAGTEYKILLSKEIHFSLRAGYNSRSRKSDGLNGVTTGFGFQFKSVNLDYAWIPLGNLGDSHRFSLGFKY